MATPKIGDVVELNASKGFFYAIYTYKHANYGALLRVLDSRHDSRPNSFVEVLNDTIRFDVFFPLKEALRRGIVEIAANLSVPEHLQSFPIFRAGVVNLQSKKVDDWWLWDGQTEWRVGSLTPEQRKLSIRGVWNDTMLVDRIEPGWLPENDLR